MCPTQKCVNISTGSEETSACCIAPLDMIADCIARSFLSMDSMPSNSGLRYRMHLYPLTRKLSDLRKLPVPTKSIILRVESLLVTGWVVVFRRYKYRALPAKNNTATAPRSVPTIMPTLALLDNPFGFGPMYVYKKY